MGGSAYPLDELRHAGVDLATPAPVDAALEKFERILDDAEATLAKLEYKQGSTHESVLLFAFYRRNAVKRAGENPAKKFLCFVRIFQYFFGNTLDNRRQML